MATETLSLLISAKDNASAALNGVQGSIDKLKTRLSSLSGILSTGVLLGGMAKFATAAQEQEGALALLGSHVKQLGGEFDNYKKRVLETTAALQRKTVYGDEKQIAAVASLTLIMGDQEQALTKLPDLLDFAAASNMDLEGATRLYGRAIEGDVSALTRYFPMVKQLIDKNMSAEDIMKKVTEATKGSAEAFGDTQPLTKLQNALSDTAEDIGKGLLPAITKLNKVFMALPTSLKQLVVLAPILVAAFVAMGPVIGGIVAGVALLGVGYGALKNQIDTASKSTGEFTIETESSIQATKKAKERLIDYFAEMRKGNVEMKTAQDFLRAGSHMMGVSATDAAKIVMDSNNKLVEDSKRSNAEKLLDNKEYSLKLIELGRLNYNDSVAFLKLLVSKTKSRTVERLDAEKKLADYVQQVQEKSAAFSEEQAKKETELVLRKIELGQMDFNSASAFLSAQVELYKEGTLERLNAEEALWQYISGQREAEYAKQAAFNKAEKTATAEKTEYAAMAYQAWTDTAKMGVGSLQNSLGTMFGEILNGGNALNSLKKMWSNFTSSILNLIGQLIAKLIVMQVLMAATGLGGGIGSFAGALLKGFQTPFGQSRVVPGNSQTAVPVLAHGGERIGRDAGSGLTINFNGTSYNSDDTAQAIMRQLHQYKLRTGVSFA